MKLKLKTIILITLCCLMLFPVPVQAASKKNVRAVKQVTYDFLEAASKYDQSEINKCILNKNYQLFSKNSPITKLIRKQHKKYFLYKITKVKVKKKTASVRVSVQFLSLMGAASYAYENMEKYWIPNMNPLTVSSFDREFATTVSNQLAPGGYEDDYLLTTSFTIPLVKKGGKWKIKKMTAAMEHVSSCEIYTILGYDYV